ALPALPQPGQGGAAAPDGPVTPWRPPVEDPFLSAMRSTARPGGLGRRFFARLIDGAVVFGLAAAAAVPFAGKVTDHIQDKIEDAENTGRTVTVWLVDGTTGPYLALILGVYLVLGLLYEALPVSTWGRTLGKKICGIKVLDIEGQDPPSFGAATRRWLTYGVLGLLGIGLVNVLWCLFDKPWRQCWHDKAARTYVAGS
ncbi:RDD family protein, partial [Streptomyces sp. A7024]